MRSMRALLIAAATAMAITRAEETSADAAITNTNDEGMMGLLQDGWVQSTEFIRQFFQSDEIAVVPSSVEIVILNLEDDVDEQPLSTVERIFACSTAMKRFHEQDDMQMSTFIAPFYQALHLFDETSCDDLKEARLVAECNRVLGMEETISHYVEAGKSDKEICELMVPDDTVNGKKGNGLSCKLCQRFVQMIDQALEKEVSQVEQVREIIGDICDAMAADSMCHTFLNYYDDIVAWLKHGTDPLVICTQISMCTPGSDEDELLNDLSSTALTVASSAQSVATIEGPGCFYCVHTVIIARYLNEYHPAQLPKLKNLLHCVCKLSPQVCKCSALEKNFDQIVTLLQQGQTPEAICDKVGICPKDASMTTSMGRLPSVTESLEAVVVASSGSFGNGTECLYCDFATTLAEIFIQEDANHDIDQIRSYVDLICDMLGADNACHQYLNAIDYVIDALESGTHPRDICIALKYCPAKVTAVGALDVSKPACFSCTHIVVIIRYLDAYSPSLLPAFKSVLRFACKLTPQVCRCNALETNYDQIVSLVKRGNTPQEICESLGICEKNGFVFSIEDESVDDAVSALIIGSRTDNGDTKECFYCDYFTTLLEIALQEDPDQINELREYADMICEMLGESNQCHVYIKKFDFVIDSLKNGTHPRPICVSLNYCTAKQTVLVPAGLPAPASELASFNPNLVNIVSQWMSIPVDGCFFCTEVAAVLQVAIAQDPTQITEIRQIADVVCGFLPKDNQCHQFVSDFDKIVDSLQKGEAPKAICVDLHMCKKTDDAFVSSTTNDEQDSKCNYCSGVVTVLEYANDERPEEVQQLREAAGLVCDLLPSKDKCHQDLELFDQALAQLKAGKTPHEICQTLKFCSANDLVKPLTLADLKALGMGMAPSRCTTCKQNSLLLVSLITKPDKLSTFTQEIDSVCRLIPESTECEMLMKHLDVIVDALKHGEDIETICMKINECDEPDLADDMIQEDEEKSMSVGCIFCEYTAEILVHAGKDANKLRLAKLALESVCSILPPSARCDVLSSKFDELLALVEQGNTPSEACHAIALCDVAFTAQPSVFLADVADIE